MNIKTHKKYLPKILHYWSFDWFNQKMIHQNLPSGSVKTVSGFCRKIEWFLVKIKCSLIFVFSSVSKSHYKNKFLSRIYFVLIFRIWKCPSNCPAFSRAPAFSLHYHPCAGMEGLFGLFLENSCNKVKYLDRNNNKNYNYWYI